MVAALVSRLPGAEVTLVDVDESRAAIAKTFGVGFALPADAPCGADVVIHASTTPQGLATALGAAGMEATVLELSWYGQRLVPAPLGDAFHSQRLKLISSQVGQIASSRRPRWDYARRRDAALRLLFDDRLNALITEEIAFPDLPAALPRLFAPGAAGLQTVVRYA
jgi:threonine dehydrogenase-like Zn-dependent dehydrogenase